jgi:hypothetical protein
MADVPHFDMPFRFNPNNHPAVVEQDEYKDVQNCVECLLRTQIGDRVELPDFGHDDWTFDVQPVDLGGLMQNISIHEPRAISAIEQQPDWIDPLIAKVQIHLDQMEGVT